MINPRLFTWHDAIYYGEVFGFLAAWVIGLFLAMDYRSESKALSDSQNFASVSRGTTGPLIK